MGPLRRVEANCWHHAIGERSVWVVLVLSGLALVGIDCLVRGSLAKPDPCTISGERLEKYVAATKIRKGRGGSRAGRGEFHGAERPRDREGLSFSTGDDARYEHRLGDDGRSGIGEGCCRGPTWTRSRAESERRRAGTASDPETRIDAAVHAKGRTLPELVSEIAMVVGVEISKPEESDR